MKRFAFDLGIIFVAFFSRGLWVRWRGYGPGISIAWRPVELFSERNGHRKVFRIGPLRLERLARYEP